MDRIQRNWQALTERVEQAAGRAGRSAAEITIVAVTKTRQVAEIDAALAAGVTDVGENRVQEADAKVGQVSGDARWHLIGQLQRNKAGRAVDLFDVVQSVDSIRLAEALQRRAAAADKPLEVMVQVNTAGAEQQGGVAPDELPALLDTLTDCPQLTTRGLMTIGAHTDDVSAVRGCFQLLRRLADEHQLDVRSMGMSGDFEIAIEEGATLVRVGTALFGERDR